MARKQTRRVPERQEAPASDISEDISLDEISDGDADPDSRVFDPNDYEQSIGNGSDQNSEDEEDGEDNDEAELEMLAALQVQREQEEEQRPVIDNHEALCRLEGELSLKHLPWVELQTITSSEPVVPDDVHDDLKRELAFYTQALEAAELGLKTLRKAKVPVDRPADYFAEMVKTDAHMEKIRRKLMDERTKVIASEDARRQRELKKFGKKVQQEKTIERQKTKSAELDKIKALKKSKFDVAVDKAVSSSSTAASKGARNVKRQKKDARFGFGGKKRNSKSNTAKSTDDISGFNSRTMKQGFSGSKAKKGSSGTKSQQRPGKARRLKAKM
ncbi:eukaryotic rRNA processing protein EBP2-domain-containing protein [Syncephalis fuscata]|nr:eukaryotic rRNA processing protein EBP2-domain-containing protein [Syncephalis fuscata]